MNNIIKDIIIDHIKPDETVEATTVYAQAFSTSPINLAVWDGQVEEASSAIEKFGLIIFGDPLAVVFIAKLDNRVVGMLRMIEYPHCQMSSSQKQEILPKFQLVLKDAMPRFIEWRSAWEEHDPNKPHWHIGPFGVYPELQGKGIGSKILTKCLEFIDQRKGSAYLETDKSENARLYERFGFRIVEEMDILGVKNWFMWRDPS